LLWVCDQNGPPVLHAGKALIVDSVGIGDLIRRPLALALCVAQARQLSVAANPFVTRMEQALSRAPF